MKKKREIFARPNPPMEVPQRARGPQPSFSREQIAAAAVAIADEEGIEAVSMRRIAAYLGSGTASLYRYITKKDDLLDLMSDVVLPQYMLAKLSGQWRKDLRQIAFKSREMILEHPWIVGISTFRSSLGPNTLRWLELMLGSLDGLGMDIDEMLVVSTTLFAFARGYAAGEIAEQDACRRSGLDRERWMMGRAQHTRAILETGNYPMFRRVVMDARAPHDPDAAERGFSLGLDHILDGVELSISAGLRGPKGAAKLSLPKRKSGGS